ncbi:hypothetical protein LF65_03608 [Clostridium beijerinckii]|uniref:Methyl-accepting chemotaxis protein n=1 Tax=Clostridium beijerinckii TaxID=1520 RepID=A0A0B5QD70_CLOBE|nr:methyl-accepting chemotaxis protein [Clostridium beijerinckii]AJH00165.1 hypothetical protein LF65_03608 [Clostridium beijerinckii]
MNEKFFKGLFIKINAKNHEKKSHIVGKTNMKAGINSINLRSKLYISFIIIIVGMIISSAVGIINIRKINEQSKALYEHNLKSITLLHNIREALLLDLNTVNAISNKNYSNSAVQAMEDSTKMTDELLKQLKAVADTNFNKSLTEKIMENYGSYEASKKDLINNCNNNGENISVSAAMLKNVGHNIDALLDSLINYNQQQADLANKNNAKIYNSTMKLSIIMLMVIILLSVLISAVISTNLDLQVKRILAYANVLKNKDLSIDIEVMGKDEFSKISRALIETKESIREIIGNISEMSQDIGSGSEELSATTEEINSKMDEVDSNTETIVKGTEELSALTEEVTASTIESNSIVNKLSEKAQLGKKLSMDIEKRAIEIKQKTNESLKSSDELYRINQSKIIDAINEGKIVDEVNVMADNIGQIAEQTNLLSLNAAIEAARAGEHGRGFAVVADEVRKLANQSSKTVMQIQSIVVQVQNAFTNLSKTSEDVLQYMKDNVRQDYMYFVDASNQYAEDAELISSISNEIANSATEMSAASTQIGSAMQKVSLTTQDDLKNSESISLSISEVARALDEIAKTATNQAQMSEELGRIIGEFKLN